MVAGLRSFRFPQPGASRAQARGIWVVGGPELGALGHSPLGAIAVARIASRISPISAGAPGNSAHIHRDAHDIEGGSAPHAGGRCTDDMRKREGPSALKRTFRPSSLRL